MKKLAALLLAAPLALGQSSNGITVLGPSPGCFRGEVIGVKMLPMAAGHDMNDAARQCFSFCSTIVSQTRVRANVIDKSNRRKSRVQCKCFDAEDTVNPVTLTCTDTPVTNTTTGEAFGGNGKGKGKSKSKGKRKEKGRCQKCVSVQCYDGSVDKCSSVPPPVQNPVVEAPSK